MSASRESDCDQQRSRQLVALLNHLFETRRVNGRLCTLAEVSKATGISVPYLSLLRKGKINAVAFQRIVALARFFRVSLEYFREDPPIETMDDEVREALAQPLVRELVLRVGKLGLAERALVLQVLEHADHLLPESASLPAAPPANAPSLRNECEPAT